MQIEIEYAHPRHQGIVDLLSQHHALMQSLFPAEANHYLVVDALCQPDIHFIGARVDGIYRACGAIQIHDGYAEVKSMFTDPNARGLGLADQILTKLSEISASLNRSLMRLETGVGLDAAHRLYHRHGFQNRGPFGDYSASQYSVFMEKSLAA